MVKIKKKDIIPKDELIGLNPNRNFIMQLIGISFIIVGVRSYDFNPSLKSFIVIVFGALILLFQMNYLVNIGNEFKNKQRR